MNLVYLTVTYRVMKSNPLAFFTLGIFGCVPKGDENTVKKVNVVIENEVSVPHVWYMAFQLTLVLLYANADINSRVASTIPIYYWSFASLIMERPANKDKGMYWFARFACLHNLLFLGLNLILFHAEIGFF